MSEINFFPQSSRSGKERYKASKDKKVIENITPDYMVFGYDYFDNPGLGVGYGGYKYDGRYEETARKICKHYNLKQGDKVLEVGCAKGYMLVEFYKLGLQVRGIDYSDYAVKNAHPDIRNFTKKGDISSIPFPDKEFDFVFGKEILPHVPEDKIKISIKECMRVSKGPIFFEIQTGNTGKELEYMVQWDRTHKILKPVSWWNSLFKELDYKGDFHYKILIPEDIK
ncbi:MAG: hypothetical protein A2539_07635 [Elusimicrobia bacterium RIFOXYD2_FULL_34_15]|nr:MAG: hypothetical protein A2539_07635 [Elusimicrobia bacterium RIFOXYD2_FULL_34_15]